MQTWIVKRVASYLSGQLNTTVSVDAVAIDFFSKVRLNGILIKDLKNDTLLQANEITALIDFFAPSENKIYLSEVSIKKGIVKIQRYGKEKEYNIDFLIHYFSPAQKDTSAKKFDFNPGEIRLENMIFVYRDHRYNDKSTGIDFDDLRLEHLDASVSEIKPDSSGLLAKIDNLSFVERSGFKVDYLESIAYLSYEGSTFDEVLIKTPFSNINCDLKFKYDSLDDLSEFITKVRIESDFQECELD